MIEQGFESIESGIIGNWSGTTQTPERMGGEKRLLILQPVSKGIAGSSFEQCFTWDCQDGDNPFPLGVTLHYIPEDFEIGFFQVTLQIKNRTGSTQTYSYQIYNNTTDEIISDTEDEYPGGVELSHLSGMTGNHLFGNTKVRQGDGIYAIVNKGVLGTSQDSASHGEIRLEINYLANAKETSEWLRARKA